MLDLDRIFNYVILLRRSKGLRFEDLREMTGLSFRTIDKVMKRNPNVRIGTVIKLIDAMESMTDEKTQGD